MRDTARFDAALGRDLLRPMADIDALACGSTAVWFVVHPGMAQRVAGLAGVVRVFADRDTELWRAPARPCP